MEIDVGRRSWSDDMLLSDNTKYANMTVEVVVSSIARIGAAITIGRGAFDAKKIG